MHTRSSGKNAAKKLSEKKAREIREKSGEKYLPFISSSDSRLPVTSGDISGDATFGDDPPQI
jgi:hypothetical protein